MRSCVLALLVGCAATRAPRIDIVLNTERRSISELAAENGFTSENDPLNEVVVGIAATFAVRTCFPTDEAFATVWMRRVSVEQVGDTARVSLLREVSRGGGRFALVHDPHPCLDRISVLLPIGAKFSGGLNTLTALIAWGVVRKPVEDVLQLALAQMQVVQTLKARCFPTKSGTSTVLLAWGPSSVRAVDVRNGNSYTGNECSKHFALMYPLDVAGELVTPQAATRYSEITFDEAASDIAKTRAQWRQGSFMKRRRRRRRRGSSRRGLWGADRVSARSRRSQHDRKPTPRDERERWFANPATTTFSGLKPGGGGEVVGDRCCYRLPMERETGFEPATSTLAT